MGRCNLGLPTSALYETVTCVQEERGTMHFQHQLAVFICILLTEFHLSAAHGVKWTYTGPDGEPSWSKTYPFCGGVFQSPIDFQTELLQYDPTLRPIEVRDYNLSTLEQLTLGNNGHSVQLSLPSQMHIASLPHRFSASQLHFHWGSPNKPAGSEHAINGNQFAAEMHVVHFNSDKYPNISVAADKQDGLAVLGVLIELGQYNPAFDQLLAYINRIQFKDQKVQVPAFNIRSLLPARLDEYYRYDGSLTTPPCYPSVLWTVFRNPVSISQHQFLSLATALYASSEQELNLVSLKENFRSLQEADDRRVLVSFRDDLGLLLGMRWGVLLSIVIASVLGLILIGTLVFFVLRKKRAEKNLQKDTDVIFKPSSKKEEDISKV
ncbi:carbonic anhydrase 12 isoform X2 [Amia ocellicauda]|uniref:carbonic anhydrase 12 isoform X2 n=1 Tax=Amia ocellicauda TaxID=2972642 RepID=UPI003463A781